MTQVEMRSQPGPYSHLCFEYGFSTIITRYSKHKKRPPGRRELSSTIPPGVLLPSTYLWRVRRNYAAAVSHCADCIVCSYGAGGMRVSAVPPSPALPWAILRCRTASMRWVEPPGLTRLAGRSAQYAAYPAWEGRAHAGWLRSCARSLRGLDALCAALWFP